MTISELSDQDLSRWIAENFFPREICLDGTMPDMIDDPGMTLMLLEKLLEKLQIHIEVIDGSVRLEIGSRSGSFGAWVGIRTCPDLGRAVAEAFALANGWKP